MGDQPFIKFYPSDFLGGTSGLSPAERGVYITLLCLMYENDGPILRDDSRLSRRCGSPKAAFIRALDSLFAEGKLVEVDGMLTNKRAEKAIVDRTNRTQNSTHAAKQRWGAHAEKSQQNQSKDYAVAMPEQCVSDASQKPEPEVLRDTNVSLCQNDAVDHFNSIAERVGWPRVQKLTKARQSALAARIKDCGGYKNWTDAMDRAAKSNFLLGKATGTTPASFDWLNAPRNFTKLMEGNYDNRDSNGARNGTDTRSGRPGAGMAEAFASVAERLSRDYDRRAAGGGGFDCSGAPSEDWG